MENRRIKYPLGKAFKFTKVDYLLLFSLIGFSVIPILKSSFGSYILVATLIFLFFKLSITKGQVALLIIIFLLEIYHNTAFFNYDSVKTRQVIMFFLLAALVVNYLKANILQLYMNILYVITNISFIFFVLYYISIGIIRSIMSMVPSFFIVNTYMYGVKGEQVNPIIYNFDHNFLQLGRNNGPFWEPTIFAIMLIIAQIFNLLQNKTLFNKKGIVFTIGIITTFSTTCFLSYFILLLVYFILHKSITKMTKVIVCAIIIFVGINLYTNVSFLDKKIQSEITDVDKNIDKRGGDSRLASALLDISEISVNNNYLLFGKGSTWNIRVGTVDKDVLRNCGDTALIVEFGLLFFILYFTLMYLSFYRLTKFYNLNKFYAVVFTTIFLINGFSEVIFDQAFFHIFIFLGFAIYDGAKTFVKKQNSKKMGQYKVHLT